jgi:cytochrome c-type biogenesis protein CcmH/NrfG
VCAARAHRSAEAESLAARALALDHGSVVARQALALALAGQRRFREAFAQLDTARRAAPSNTETPALEAQIRRLAGIWADTTRAHRAP